MGEISDMIFEGILCEECGACVVEPGEEPAGYPQKCEDCK